MHPKNTLERQTGTFLQLALCQLVLPVLSVFAAEPYRPVDPEEVLEVLPRAAFSNSSEVADLRRHLAETPHDEALAVKVASRFVKLGSLDGNPRCYGYARAALSPWWDDEQPSPAILHLRAKLMEKDHRYDLALVDLQLLVEKEPRNAQAWVEIANLYRVLGRYDEAMQACDSLSEFSEENQVDLCRIPIQAITGDAPLAYKKLNSIVPKAVELWPAAVPWMRVIQGSIARTLGDDDLAEQHFLDGLGSNPGNLHLLRYYADLLLDQQRNEEVVLLLRDHVMDNGILLRAAIAANRQGRSEIAEVWKTQLRSRFQEIRLRGSEPHGRYEARFTLELLEAPEQALELALENWRKQKELRDSRNVLEAALATRDAAAAEHVLQFLRENQTDDAILSRLVHQLESL